MPWFATGTGHAALEEVLGTRPEWWATWKRNYDTVTALVEPVRAELCRLLMAQLLDCRPELDVRSARAREAGLTEEKIAELGRWRDSEAFTDAERACLELTEGCYLDVKSVTDEQVANVREHITDSEVFALIHAIIMFEMTQRALILFQIEPEPGGPHLHAGLATPA